jgi:hypothetical protein
MKRFLLFAGDNYYPEGGWDDFINSFDTLEEVELNLGVCDWFHVVDSTTGEKITPERFAITDKGSVKDFHEEYEWMLAEACLEGWKESEKEMQKRARSNE